MRWTWFLILAAVGFILQNTVVPVLWLPTPLGEVGPELLAALTVFVALNVRGRTNAALAGWVLGFAVDLNLSDGGMGLLALLYAGGAAVLYRAREVFFRDRALVQIILSFVFCAVVFQVWTAYDVFVVTGGPYARRAAQALCLSAYTAVLTPVVCAAAGRARRLIFPPSAGGRRR